MEDLETELDNNMSPNLEVREQDSVCDSAIMSPIKTSFYNREDVSSDEDKNPVQRIKKRVQRFSDSDTEKENVQIENNKMDVDNNEPSSSNSDNETRQVPFKSKRKSRLRMGDSSSDSDVSKNLRIDERIEETEKIVKNEEQQMRMTNKRDKMKQKFKGLLSSRGKQTLQSKSASGSDKSSDESGLRSEGSDDNEMTSIAKIKQKLKKSMASFPSVCDPDTSDEESSSNNKLLPKPKQKKVQKSTKMIEAKPMRMSAKQAMENMQLIKSESNRMLREKAVSLPYHRPKVLSLKDMMARRKPAIASDGKAFPIKMNEDQLRQYALQLEERQKEMMELCKSETDDDDSEGNQTDDIIVNENGVTKTDNEQTKNAVVATNATECLERINEHVDNEICREINENVNIKDGNDNSDKVDITVLNDSNFDELTATIADPVGNNESNTEVQEQNDSNTELKLVYNSFIEEDTVTVENISKEQDLGNNINENSETKQREEINPEQQIPKVNSEPESQLISLHYTEKDTDSSEKVEDANDASNENPEQMDTRETVQDDFFSDDDVNLDDIDRIIENAEIMKESNDNINSPLLIRDPQPLKANPKLMGVPGMVIDLDGTDPFAPKKLTGVELLKERFSYYAKLKTPEELEKDKEKRLKPGALHLKLKHELEEKIAEQRSLEWAKRLEEEKQQHKEMDSILDDADEADDSIEEIKSNLKKDNGEANEESESEEEEELIENDVEMKDKTRKSNPMVDDEAEESSCDENEQEHGDDNEVNDNINDDEEEEANYDDDSSSDDTSSDSEEETAKPKKGRILKAFEDSDDEGTPRKDEEVDKVEKGNHDMGYIDKNVETAVNPIEIHVSSQDDDIQLAQRHKSASDDLFASQENPATTVKGNVGDEVLGTQTFSILELNASEVNDNALLSTQDNFNVLYPSQLQPYHDPNLNAITEGLTQNILNSQPITQSSQSQPIGEDILALCTGKFYENQFVSQPQEDPVETMSQESFINNDFADQVDETEKECTAGDNSNKKPDTSEAQTLTIELKQIAKDKAAPDNNLKSILEELDDPAFDQPKPNKYFTGGIQRKQEQVNESQMKKRFVIDSDDEANETAMEGAKKKKLKKKKPERRALQISDDEEEEEEEEIDEDDDVMSDLEDDTEKLVEYDSEENEIEVIQQPENPKKKKRKLGEFFENEAELTSEDEWVGSGDEDEHGLDRMEREEGDDDVFHQGKLRKELGLIHMRDVMDQDKREVRLLQELLFEDGDLGGGHRQRKFRWKNAGGDDETGVLADDITDTQEEEFESEEQWRKQRHEREVFLRQMQEDVQEENVNVTVNRTTIIKANLSCKSMSTLLQEVNKSKTDADSPVVPEKKTPKDVPSPKKSFAFLQQSYHGSLLSRGRGALARLAALATPLAGDDAAPHVGSLAPHKRNFVFAAVSPGEHEPKATKRKADVNIGTPKLMKKLKIEEKKNNSKSLLDRLNV